MAWFRRQTSLFQAEPGTLSIADLELVQTALMLKLIRVSQEFGKRCRDIAEIGDGVPDTEQNVALLGEGAKRHFALAEQLQTLLDGGGRR